MLTDVAETVDLTRPSPAAPKPTCLRDLTRALTGTDVAEMTPPEQGLTRLMLNDGRRVFAFRRASADHVRREVALLTALKAQGAPVPEVVGFRDTMVLQADTGMASVAEGMAEADAGEAEDLAQRSLHALTLCRAAMDRAPRAKARLTGLGTRRAWAERQVARLIFVSYDLGLTPPDLDPEALTTAILRRSDRFVRWQADLTKAAVTPDGSVVWRDWQQFGLRGGCEDMAGPLADPNWTLTAAATARVLADALPQVEEHRLVTRMAALLIVSQFARVVDPTRAASAPPAKLNVAQVARLSARLRDLCEGDPLLQGCSDWAERLTPAVCELVQ
ncbi:hypothetical protein JANAI62_08370 [Jannaschia pagri]|uniref:Aminoglycoside phosphotransferase domain-containing protein n=1 Tax=Jannaschia pagri TaxID=2829797 RepID=A0ABQ4NJ32_9RHOB|nr:MULTISPECIES: hypothetical protein [unclassified Jannaschia]GIT89678.1 hypothetical protein JANAI61_01360 [Jannaschia sp. AI_61]GIT94214.1 hypothetical protein JANAI62_08370 [Jannaschia sp. AI_62]